MKYVQQRLHVRPVSGWFGPITRATVRAFQRAHHIRPTGNVGPLTWRALLGWTPLVRKAIRKQARKSLDAWIARSPEHAT